MTSARSARRRALMAVGISAAMVLGGATLAAADVDDETYEPPPAPTLEVEVLTPICDGDVPYLNYAVDVANAESPPSDVTITWVNPGGSNVVQSGLSLSGRVLWPGAEVDGAGNPLDWPGWRLENGVWVEGDEWDWVRPSVQVIIAVNPETTATVAYPPSSPNCATNPPGQGDPTPPGSETSVPPAGGDASGAAGGPGAASSSSSILPQTGGEVAALLAIAVGLLAAGVATVLTVRRRRHTA